jgi:hypothetical protein
LVLVYAVISGVGGLQGWMVDTFSRYVPDCTASVKVEGNCSADNDFRRAVRSRRQDALMDGADVDAVDERGEVALADHLHGGGVVGQGAVDGFGWLGFPSKRKLAACSLRRAG